MARLRLVNVAVTYIRPPDKLGGKLNSFVRAALIDTVMDWYHGTLPLHFEPAAVNKYGYKKRTASYMRKKAKKWHHQKPLVMKVGDPKGIKRTIGSMGVRVTTRLQPGAGSGAASATLRMRVPPRTSQQYREEIVRTTDDEAMAMAKRLRLRILQQIARWEDKKQMTIDEAAAVAGGGYV